MLKFYAERQVKSCPFEGCVVVHTLSHIAVGRAISELQALSLAV